GISSGAPNENQTLTVTASNSNPALVTNLNVSYTSPSAIGTVAFALAPDASGSATITVTVNDGGASNNLISRSFTVTVNPVNDPPTLDQLRNLTLDEDALPQSVNLTGITSGAPNESQALTVTASNSNPALVTNLNVSYTSPSGTGTVAFALAPNASGSATITVMVSDGGASNNIVSRSFTVTVNPVNDPPTISDIPNQTNHQNTVIGPVAFTVADVETPPGSLTLSANSTDTLLVPTNNIVLAGSGGNRTVTVTPAANQSGTALITVTVQDADGGSASSSFLVVVWPPLEIRSIARQTNDTIVIRFAGIPGRAYEVEASPDFSAWTNLGIATEGGPGQFEFEDTGGVGLAARFYRLLAP
ncbi:MAG: hypothetical protein DME25_07070, partial [Verrucomicrobia bacterium]